VPFDHPCEFRNARSSHGGHRSVAPISHGGFNYYGTKHILREVAKRFEVAGADFVKVSSSHDPSGITSLLDARTSLDFIGSIFH
jgi:agmatinase